MGRPRKEQPSQFIEPKPVVPPGVIKATVAEVISRKEQANARRAAKAAGTHERR